jgi:outer membrane protein assembly factor BamB
MRTLLAVVLLLSVSAIATADDSPLHHWQFDADHIKDRTVKAVTGPLDATIVGPVRFEADKPGALMLDGDNKNKHRIDVTDDLGKAGLPTKALTVEAWVRIDKPLSEGGIIGAVGGQGPAQRGWLLGYTGSQFSFGLSSGQDKGLTTVKARTTYQAGFWYQVVGVYDGAELRIYVDGQLQGHAKAGGGAISYPAQGAYVVGAFRNGAAVTPLTGRLESVSVFGRAPRGAEVAGRFDARKVLFPDMETVRPTVADWPTYLRDNQRTGMATEKLQFPLRLRWVYKARYAPRPAWPEEAKHDYWHGKYDLAERVTFDRVFHVVSVGDQLYFASSADDKLYCLDAATGRERWTFFTEGPLRLAPAVVGERVLFGSDDGSAYCVNARDGTLVWRQPLGPSNRRLPGNSRIVSAWPVRTDVLAEDDKGYVCAGVFPSQGVVQATLDLRDGTVLQRTPLGITPQGYLERQSGKLFVATGRNPAGAFVNKLKRQGKEIGKEVSALPADYPHAFIGAGDVRIGGGNGKLAAFRLEDGAKLWSAEVEGRVFSLAVSRGRLFASTDKGHVYCFTAAANKTDVIEPRRPVELPYPDEKLKERYASAARWILQQSGVTKGYCLVLGSGDGRLAYELARQSELQVVGREPDATKVAESRRALDAAGLYGQVAIHQGTLDELPYTDYLFNLVVSDSLVVDRAFAGPREEALRVLRPAGGVAIFGLRERDLVRRAPLEGAGEWSHMYGDAGNTACSGDQRVTGPLLLQWFGAPGAQQMIDRHHRTAAPLYKDGRLFVPGEDRVTAVDAYNGTILWDRQIPDSRRVVVFKDCSYLAAGEQQLYVVAADRCLALNAQTGKEDRVFTIPNDGTRQEWGYVGVVGDVLLGSAVKPGSSRRTQSQKIDQTQTYYDFVPVVGSDYLFGFEHRTGKHLWTYRPQGGLILNTTLAVGAGTVFLVESRNAETAKKPISRAKLEELLGKGSSLVALDLRTGKERWRKPAPFETLQHNVYLAFAQGKVVVSGSRNSGTDKQTATVLYDIHVFDAADGTRKWFKTVDTQYKIGGDHGEQDQHCVIVGDKLYCEPAAFDLHSGEPISWKWPWAGGRKRGGCGNISASATSFFFRDENVAAFDLTSDRARRVTTETRPGCWINLIPAGGLLLAPEASSGCTCNFSVQTSLALVPAPQGKSPKKP